MADNRIVFVLLTFARGELLGVAAYSTQEKALKFAATHVHESFDADFVRAVAEPGKEDEVQEFVDNMRALFAQGDYRGFADCWDDFVAGELFAGPSPANFDIEELEIDGKE